MPFLTRIEMKREMNNGVGFSLVLLLYNHKDFAKPSTTAPSFDAYVERSNTVDELCQVVNC